MKTKNKYKHKYWGIDWTDVFASVSAPQSQTKITSDKV